MVTLGVYMDRIGAICVGSQKTDIGTIASFCPWRWCDLATLSRLDSTNADTAMHDIDLEKLYFCHLDHDSSVEFDLKEGLSISE
ncbi:hypothetical protein H5410_058686 [Solanum commersonii]|uniref:Uncharacterized protein n=1 Tax=Solanum commersonii TaxID=4109 RepID=A0A9J5WU88_SOLCO|nr:hypothetical protein H5410_058686 [Solanum commersonii]